LITKHKSRTEFGQPRSSGYETLPLSNSNNDYAIILVHGFGGWVPDETQFFGNYWKYADEP
jgi:hypothetical protein